MRTPPELARPLGAVLLVLALAACSSDRPEVAEIAEGLTTGTSLFPVAEQQAECAAEVLRSSELDDDLLRAIAESDTEREVTAGEAEALARLQVTVLETCPG